MTSSASTNSDQSEETSQSSDSVSFHSSSSPQPSYGLPTLKKRGRPRKSQCTNPALYNSPLGYNYNPRSQYLYRQVSSYPYPYPSSMGHSNPSYYGNIFHNTPYQYNYHPMYNNTPYNTPYRFPPYFSPYPNYQIRPPPTPPLQNPPTPSQHPPTTTTPQSQPKKYIPVSPVRGRPKRTRKSAYVPSQPHQKLPEEEMEVEQISDTSSDIEKLLSHNSSQDTYLVKYKNKSYIHCSWVSKNTILQSRSGSIKIRRFRPKTVPFDPEYLIVEKILLLEDSRCLIKWKKLSHELSTFEETENVKNCENYTTALTEYNRRIEKAILIKNSRSVSRMDTTLYNRVDSNLYTSNPSNPNLPTTFYKPVNYRPPRDEMLRFEKSPSFKNNNTLRDYQLEGLNWLLNRWYHRQSCIMADEMGLGKTVQSVVFTNTIHTIHHNPGPYLIVAPLSTLIHWEREYTCWTDLRILVYHGSGAGRDVIRNYEFFYKEDISLPLFDVLITTYEMCMAGLNHLKDINFCVGIFDEAHRLKNINSKASISARELNIDYRILLSGTPLQNNLGELWSLLNFIDPYKYDDCNHFLMTYTMNKSEDVERLQAVLKTLMLRRMKDDVEKSIPVKEETIVEVELTMIQKRFYRAIVEKNIEFLRKGDNAPNLLNAMMELRKCCIHPYLILGAEEKILGEWIYKQRSRGVLEGLVGESRMGGVNERVGELEGVSDKSIKQEGVSDKDMVEGVSDKSIKEEGVSDKDLVEGVSDKSIKQEGVSDEDLVEGVSGKSIKEEGVSDATDKQHPFNPNSTETKPLTTTLSNPSTTLNLTNSILRTVPVLENNTFTSLLQQIPLDEYYKIMIQSSGKMVLLDKLLAKLKGSHKVLIFSQMTRCLDLLGEYLNYRKYKYERIDGSVRGDCRQEAIDRFCDKDSDVFVFLLCTRAGGVGINLTAADTVIIFDSDWNPQNDLQAQARCHRIGQLNEVKVYRLVTRNTYEREMFDKAGLKLGLDKAILQRLSHENKPSTKYKDSIELLLRKGAYGVLMENDEISVKFCEEDIDQILERRSKVVKHDNLYEGGNIFSKASFFVEEEIDDPDFWDNLVNKKKSEENEGRIKRQMRRLGREGVSYSEVEEIDRLIKEVERRLSDRMEGKGVSDKGLDGGVSDSTNEQPPVNKSIYTTNEQHPVNNSIDIINEQPPVNKSIDTTNEQPPVNNSIDSINEQHPVNNSINNTNEQHPVNNSIDSTNEQHPVNNTNNTSSDFTSLVFLTVLRKGVNSLSTLKYPYDPIPYLNHCVSHCLEKVESKMKEDYSLHMDGYLKGVQKGEVNTDNTIYDRFGNRFLLRVQVVVILGILMKCEGLGYVEKWRGWSYEDDKRLVNWVLTNGYDNYPCNVVGSSRGKGKDSGKALDTNPNTNPNLCINSSLPVTKQNKDKSIFRGKSEEELNARIRKIVLSLNKKINENKEEEMDLEVFDVILNYGRVTAKNKENYIKELDSRVEGVSSVIEKSFKKRRKREERDEKMCYRVKMFDKLNEMCDKGGVPSIRKSSGLPRKWSGDKDKEMVEDMVSGGFKLVEGKYSIGEDVIIRRVEALIKAYGSNNKEESNSED